MPKTKISATPSVAKPLNTAAAKASAGKKASSCKVAPADIDTTKKGATAKPVDKAPMKVAAPTTITLRHLSAALSERHNMPKKQADIVLN